MLTALEVGPSDIPWPVSAGQSLTIPIGGSEDEPIQLTNIDGLAPVKAEVNTSPFGDMDAETLVGSSIGKRNIVLTFGLNPNWADQTIESLRTLLYEYFMPQLPLRIRFTSTHLPLCQIDGIVEDLVPNIFSKDPEIQVSVICPSPDFVAVAQTVINGVVGGSTDLTDIPYEGSVPAGIEVEIKSSAAAPTATGTLGVSSIDRKGARREFTLTATINTTKYLAVGTIPGSKYVRNIRVSDGLITNLLGAVGETVAWPRLMPGDNQFSVYGFLDWTDFGQTWTLKYFARFGGL